MQLPEKAVLRGYNALANDWTPLSRKPCWLSIAFHCLRDYVKRNRFAWFHRLVSSSKNFPTHYKLSFVSDKSFADDLVASGYCKCESKLCLTIHWGFCRVPTICSSRFLHSKTFTTRGVVFWLESYSPRNPTTLISSLSSLSHDLLGVCV